MTMTKREIISKIKVEKDTMKLIQLYEQDFLDVLGAKGVDDLIDQKLENLKYLVEQLRKIEEDERK